MKVPEGVIEKACSKDDMRPVLTQPWLKEGRLYATDAYCAVSVPVTETDNDTDGYVPVASLKGARKGGRKASGVVNLNTVALTDTPDGKLETARPDLPAPPDVQAVLSKERSETTIYLNAAYLLRVAQALGSEQVILTITTDEGPLIVEPVRPEDDRVGLLMPLRRNSS